MNFKPLAEQIAAVFDPGNPEKNCELTCDFNEYENLLQELRKRKCFVYTVTVVRGGYILQFDKPELKQPDLL